MTDRRTVTLDFDHDDFLRLVEVAGGLGSRSLGAQEDLWAEFIQLVLDHVRGGLPDDLHDALIATTDALIEEASRVLALERAFRAPTADPPAAA
jgi:hypothetical protein